MNVEGAQSQAQTRYALPLFITQKTKLFWGIVTFGLGASLYLLTNHFPLFEPKLLHMTWIDQAVPFIPETFWIYTSEYYLFAVVFFTAKNLHNVNKYLYSFFILQLISISFFIVYPTTYPRELFPLPSDLDWLTYALFENLRVADQPTSCLPSLHVSSCYLSSFIFLDEQRKKFPFFFIWATLVGLSTLTTKQHYLVDVIAGLFLAVAVYWVFHRWVPYRDITSGNQAKR